MLVTGIKSKPVYAPLRADSGGRYHLMVGMEPGGAALLRVLRELREAAPQALAATRVLLAGDESQAADEFAHAGISRLHRCEGAAPLLGIFRRELEDSLMGTRLYVAGPESFIGLIMQVALEFDLNKDEVRAEELGTSARRVYCVHCRATSENVRTNIVRCIGCARWLLVRDHYSRRLAAYMGVMVDAEAPGELPAIRETYL
ncbi:MAG: dimethylamine monooxygenase subunit DmmA family protein [Steroidobacteraceae bacterium]